MNKYERIQCVLEGKIPDRVPVMTHNFMMAAHEHGYTMQQYRSDPKKICEVLTSAVEVYDTDGILLDVDTALLADACGADVFFPEDIPAVVKDVQNYSIEQIIDRIGACDILSHPRIVQYLETIDLIAQWCNRNQVFLRANADQGVFSLAFLSMGMNEFLLNIIDEEAEEDIFSLMDVCYKNVLKFHKAVYAAGGHCTSYGNSASGSSMVSPAVFRKFSKPYERKLAQALKQSDIKTICHICGWVDPILDDLKDTNIPAYELDNKTDMILAQRAAKGNFVLSGNLDPSSVMCYASPQTVTAAAKELIALFQGQGGFLLGPGCALPALTPPENIHALVQAARA